MIVPTFVISGALWDIVNSYIPIAIWVVIMTFVYRQIITGRLTMQLITDKLRGSE